MRTIFSSENGFLPGSGGEENRAALQRMLDCGGYIVVDAPGRYELAGTVYIGSDTKLEFLPGTSLVRVPSGDGDGAAILNRGALTRTYDFNIAIKGLNLVCNGVDVTRQNFTGMNAHICFFYTKHTVIEDFTCFD